MSGPFKELRVVSWNVLADGYVSRRRYPRTPAHVLDPLRRRSAIAKRLAALAADVVCLQEVEHGTYDALAEGQARYMPKTGKTDGCAIFVRRSEYEVEWRELEFQDGTGHVALAALVDGIGIATTHLKWDAQGMHATTQLTELLNAWVKPDQPWIVCGDFNAEPDSAALRAARARGMVDAYSAVPTALTCNANAHARRLDFLLHTRDLKATPEQIPAIDDTTPLPSEAEPSDHIPIVASFVHEA